MGKRGCGWLALVALLLLAWPARGEERPACAVGRVVSIQGRVEIQAVPGRAFAPARLDAAICPGGAIRVGPDSRAAVELFSIETVLRLDQNTELRVHEQPEPESSLLSLIDGAINFMSRVPRRLNIRTPFTNAGVEGTEAEIRLREAEAAVVVSVLEGVVALSAAPAPLADPGALRVGSGRQAVVARGRPPVVLEIRRPRDVVAWTLYYQPAVTAAAAPEIAESVRLLAAGRAEEAEALLARVPDGTPAAAERDALRTVIAVARDEPGAEALGRDAVRRHPRSASARIALSYALQAAFKLEEARAVLREAVEQEPRDPLAWARLAELHLSFGDRRAALAAAERAAALAPGLGRTNTVRGFAALAQVRTETAKEAFGRAIQADSADPLPRLGLGLALIREGALAAGRREIEIAAALDPDDALIRSYLGKAYFEEARDREAITQFELAKRWDPADPTPYFYDALLLQSNNRPGLALKELEASIARNDNRAVYRSRLLLDQDQSVRSTSLARIYQDLGFDQQALVEGSTSLGLDPANHSAHRFLSESYRGQPRHEIARVSELLQAQLLQPVNINPVQPQLAEADLHVAARAGPADASFNEFTPLFERNQAKLLIDGTVGNLNTWSEETALSGVYDRFAASIGQFRYHTDGFRTNNDLGHQIYNAFGQVAVTDDLDLQVELRRRHSDQGDIRLNFDPEDFAPFDRREISQDSVRAGAHYNLAPGHDFIGTLGFRSTKETVGTFSADGVTIASESKSSGHDLQGQYLFNGDWLNLTAGGGFTDVDVRDRSTVNLTSVIGALCFPPFNVECITTSVTDPPTEALNGYLYANVTAIEDMIWTLGFSYDSLNERPLFVDRFNPKLGLQWNLLPDVLLRLAYFKAVKRPLLGNQTIEPTAVAGFNQLFDDLDGAESERLGAGLDFTLLPGELFAGVEASRRNIVVPDFSGTGEDVELHQSDHFEDVYRAYLNWLPEPPDWLPPLLRAGDWAFSLELLHERFRRESLAGLENLPTRVETTSVPFTIRYFSDTGVFLDFGATWLRQRVVLPATSTFDRTRDDVVLFDAAVGYRLPSRHGIVSFEVHNLLDEDFLYQDQNIQIAEPSTPRFIPARTFLLRVVLSF